MNWDPSYQSTYHRRWARQSLQPWNYSFKLILILVEISFMGLKLHSNSAHDKTSTCVLASVKRRADLSPDGSGSSARSHNMCSQSAYKHTHTTANNTYSTPLLSLNSVCSYDSVGLVGVCSLIYLQANINMRGMNSLVGRNCCCVGNFLSFWVTAWLKITRWSEGGKIS